MVTHAVNGSLRAAAGGIVRSALAIGRPFSSSTAPAGISSPYSSWQEGDAQPEAGPSRLPSLPVKSEAYDVVAEDLLFFPPIEVASAKPTLSAVKRPADRKGKARMVVNDSYESYQDSVLRTGRLPLQLAPTEYRGPRPLVVPTAEVLLARLEELGDQQLYQAWASAFEQTTYADAIKTLKKHGLRVHMGRPSDRELKLLDDLLHLRLFDLVRYMSDFKLALWVYDSHLRSIDSRYYGLAVLLERGLRDIRAAHFIHPLYRRTIAFIQHLDTSSAHHALAMPRAFRFSHPQRYLSRRQLRIQERTLSAKIDVNGELVQDLLVRIAFLLPHIRDERSLHTAQALLGYVASRLNQSAPSISNQISLALPGLDHGSSTSRAVRRTLRLSLRRAKRKGLITFPVPLLATIVRAFLGSSQYRVSPLSRHAVDKTVLVPAAYTVALHPTDYQRRRGFSSHLASGRHRSWLDSDLGMNCLDILSRHFGREPLRENDLEPVLMAAVRQRRAPIVERILDVLKQRLRSSGQRTQSNISSRPRSSNATFFLTREQLCSGADTAKEAGGDELTQDGTLNRYQAYRACIILFQLHRSIRPARTSQHDSSDRISALILRFSQHLQERIQASSEHKTNEPKAEVAIQTAEKLSEYIAGAGDDFMSRYAATWSSIRELEMSAMDPKADLTKLLAKICIDETGDELTIGQTTSMDLRDPLQLELRKWPQAHTFLMHGLARRGLLSGADAVFRALLRRSHSTSPEFENIQLDNSLLSERWAAVRMTANQLARSGQPNHRIVHFVTKRANEILALIGAKPAAVKKQEEPRASEIPPSKFYNAEASVKVSPSSRLLHSLIVGVTEWTVKPEKAVKMYFQFRKRWPLLCCDTGVLKSYLAAVNELELGPSTDLSRLDDPLLTALAEFKGHLFAQHPELANLKSPSWRPPHKRTRADSDKIPAARPLRSELGPFRPAMNFDAPTIVTYARSIWRLIRLRLAQYPSVTRDVYLLIDELLLSLVWMKHLGLRPERSALIQTVIPIRYVYLLKGWHWPDGVQWSERTSSSGVVYKTCDGMGPLSAWLAEWIQPPLPIKAEVARVYDRWWQLMYETLEAPRHGQPKLTQKQMERWQAYAAKRAARSRSQGRLVKGQTTSVERTHDLARKLSQSRRQG